MPYVADKSLDQLYEEFGIHKLQAELAQNQALSQDQQNKNLRRNHSLTFFQRFVDYHQEYVKIAQDKDDELLITFSDLINHYNTVHQGNFLTCTEMVSEFLSAYQRIAPTIGYGFYFFRINDQELASTWSKIIQLHLALTKPAEFRANINARTQTNIWGLPISPRQLELLKETTKQPSLVKPQPVVVNVKDPEQEKHDFLYSLKLEVDDSRFNVLGRGFFTSKTPDGVSKLRKILSDFTSQASSEELNKKIGEVSTILHAKQTPYRGFGKRHDATKDLYTRQFAKLENLNKPTAANPTPPVMS